MNNNTLFVLHTMEIGGSMTSMLNLLELLKKQEVEIDLFIMEHEGALLQRAKSAATLLKEDIILSSVICSKEKLLKEKNLTKTAIRILYVIAHKIFGTQKVNNLLYRWRAGRIPMNYRNVVAFQEGMTTQFVQYAKAEKKTAWIHTNFEYFAGGRSTDEMQKLYDAYDQIVCVSDASKSSMLCNLKNLEKKTVVIHNTINSEYVLNKSREDEVKPVSNRINFVSVGRFVKAKRFDRIVEASLKLAESGYKFRWVVIGDGDLFPEIQERVNAAFLEEIVILQGAQSNPYPMIRGSDYLVLTSSSETHPMVAIEALILGKPVITTAFPSVDEVIINRENGLICQNSTDGLVDGMKEVFENENLRETLTNGAKNFVYSNERILEQVVTLLK